jgi:hypothetical protein
MIRAHPLIFSRMTRRRLPGARVILTDSKRLIADNLAVISRLRLGNGMLFLRMDTIAPMRQPAASSRGGPRRPMSTAQLIETGSTTLTRN